MSNGSAVLVHEASQVAEARRAATALARAAGFGEEAVGRAAVVATEAATNLLKHARNGVVVVQPVPAAPGHDGPRVDILALDRGPGMADVAACVRDGYSTTGSPGTGLGAIVRMAEAFDIYSRPGLGTALLARMGPAQPPGLGGPAVYRNGQTPVVGAVTVPKPGETECGDDWWAAVQPEASGLMVADGLGHGPLAAAASREAARIFRERPDLAPAELVHTMHAALRSTRGAAVAIAQATTPAAGQPGRLRYVGVGNISGMLWSPDKAQHLVSHSGTLGHELRRVHEFNYAWPPGAMLVMHSDGIASHVKLETYPGLAGAHPALVAGVIYRDFQRGRDDATVVVVRPAKDSPWR